MLGSGQRAGFVLHNNFADDGPRPRVLMAYEDSNMALRAMNVLVLIAREAGDNLDIQFSIWRLDFFNSPDMREAAARQAERADVIVVVPKNRSGLPSAFRSWLEQRTGRREGRPGALVAVFDPATGPHLAASVAVRQLHAAAGLTGMDFFVSALRQFVPSCYAQNEEPRATDARIKTLSGDAANALAYPNEAPRYERE